MNYISEMSDFYNWVLLNKTSADEQALWHALMHINNKCAVQIEGVWYWRVEFTVPNSLLTSILKFSEKQLNRMRNSLIQSGRIEYKRGKGNQCGIYKIIPFDDTLEECGILCGKSVENVWKTHKINVEN